MEDINQWIMCSGIFVIGIIQVVHLIGSTAYMNQCQYIWEWILAACIGNLLYAFTGVFTIIVKIREMERTMMERITVEQQETKAKWCFRKLLCFSWEFLMMLAQLSFGIWACNTVLDSLCKQYWQEHNSNLWSMVVLEIVIFAMHLFLWLLQLLISLIKYCSMAIPMFL